MIAVFTGHTKVRMPAAIPATPTIASHQRGATGPSLPEIADHKASTPSTSAKAPQNIVSVKFTVFWRVRDAEEYLFNIKDPEAVRKIARKSLFEGLDSMCEGAIIVDRDVKRLAEVAERRHAERVRQQAIHTLERQGLRVTLDPAA